MNHVMIDLETLDTLPTAAITQIGLCEFQPVLGCPGRVGRSAIIAVDPTDQPSLGLTIGVSTFLWWLDQDADARSGMVKPLEFLGVAPVPLVVALGMVSMFFRNCDAEFAWGHGATFDISIMENAYRACKTPPPWDRRCMRDTRTIFHVAPPEWPENPTKHRADADAVAQAHAVCSSYSKLTGI
jgi:3'-5' exoribonuclease-like protein